jgi:hypothetical protein
MTKDNKIVAAIAAAEPIGPEPWPTLIPLDAPDLPTLDHEVLPAWLGGFAKALSDETETPFELAATMTTSVVSTAVARRFHVKVKGNYREPTNVWFVAALPSGNRKSAVQAAAAAPLTDWERKAAEILKPEIDLAVSAEKTREVRARELRSQAAKAKGVEAMALDAELAALESQKQSIPVVPRLWTSDATPEQLGILMSNHGERMAWLSSEGGVFDLLAGRYSSGIPNLDLVLKSFSGDAERVDRGSRPPLYLRQPLLTIGLSPQPEALVGLASKPGFRGRGLLARFIWFVPVSPLGYRSLVTVDIPDDIKAAYHEGVQQLLDLQPQVDTDGREVTGELSLSTVAHDAWLSFARAMEAEMRPGQRFEHAKDWAGKAPGAAIRLAAIFHVVEAGGANFVIDGTAMERALSFMAVAAHHAIAVFDLMGADEAVDGARAVWRWIHTGRRTTFKARDAFNALRSRFPQMKKLMPALEVLEERGYVRIEKKTEEQDGPGRPPSPTVTVRPDIVETWS